MTNCLSTERPSYARLRISVFPQQRFGSYMNIKFEYLYRDAGNYKWWCSVRVEGQRVEGQVWNRSVGVDREVQGGSQNCGRELVESEPPSRRPRRVA